MTEIKTERFRAAANGENDICEDVANATVCGGDASQFLTVVDADFTFFFFFFFSRITHVFETFGELRAFFVRVRVLTRMCTA